MKPLWSICIPTYNRAECIKLNLVNLFKQVHNNNRDDIEILVSNNCSTDETDAVIQSFIQQGNKISYYLNDTNIGPDRNFLQCIEKAKGKYILLLGDDDTILNGGIDLILSILKNTECGTVYIADRTIMYNNELPKERAKINKYVPFDDENEYIAKVSYFITFMSGMIFEKELVGDVKSYWEYIDSLLIQITFFLTAILKSKKNVFAEGVVLATKINDNGGYNLVEVFGDRFNDILRKFINLGLRDNTIAKINDDMLISFFPYFVAKILTEKTRFKDTDLENSLYKLYANNWRYHVFILPMLKLPEYLIKPYSYFPRVCSKILRLIK